MPSYDRSGSRVGGLQTGKWSCLRQEMTHAGETLETKIKGKIFLNPLRQPLVTDVHATLATFWTPIRWHWPQFVDYVKNGYDNPLAIPTATMTALPAPWDALGCGTVKVDDVIAKHWVQHFNDCYQWYMRRPDDQAADTSYDDEKLPGTAGIAKFGPAGVNLPSYATRLRTGTVVEGSDAELSVTNNKVDVRLLEELGARFRTEQMREWFGTRGYQEILQDTWNAKGSLEVEKRPMLINEMSAWLTGGNVVSVGESANLGQRAGLMNFDVHHELRPFTAPEQGIMSHWIILRFAPLFNTQSNPMLTGDDFKYADFVADPAVLRASPPEQIKKRRIAATGESTAAVGYYPRGQHWRTGWSHVDDVITSQGNYPIQNFGSGGEVNQYHFTLENAFQSTNVGHALMTMLFEQISHSDVPDIHDSIYAGAIS